MACAHLLQCPELALCRSPLLLKGDLNTRTSVRELGENKIRSRQLLRQILVAVPGDSKIPFPDGAGWLRRVLTSLNQEKYRAGGGR